MIENSYSLNLSTKEAQKNVDELNKSFELQADLVGKLEKELKEYESELKSLTGAGGKTLKQRSELNKKIAQARKGLREEKQGLKDVKAERIKSNKVLKEATKNQADYSGVLDFVDSKTGGIIGKFGKFTKMIKSATKGFNLLRVAIIGTGIGALLIAVTSLTAAFTSNEKGQKKLKRIMAAIGVVVGNLVDIFAKLGNGIISVFEDPQQAIKDFANIIKEQITNRFNAILDTVGLLGSAIKKVFQRDFSGAVEDMKKGASRAVDAMTGVEDSINKATDAVTGFIDEQVREANIMSGIMDKKEKAAKLERDLIVERSTLEGQIADLRLKARKKDEVSAEDRKQALLDANALQQQLLDKETEALILKRDAIIAQNELSGSTTADLDAEAEAIAAVNLQIRKKADAERSVQRELNTINKEIATDKLTKEQELADAIKQIKDATKGVEDENRTLEKQKINEHYTALIQLAKDNNLSTEELTRAQGEKILAIDQEIADKKLALKKQINDKIKQFDDEDNIAKLEAQREKDLQELIELGATLEERNALIKSYAEKIAEEEVSIEEEKYQQKLEKAQQWIAVLGNALGVIGQMQKMRHDQENQRGDQSAEAKEKRAKKQFEEQKKLNIAMAVVNASQAIISSLAQAPVAIGVVPNPIGIASLAMATASGIASIAAIAKTKYGGGARAPQPPQVPAAEEAQSQAPAFNIVGSSETNQLADAIGDQTQVPTKAFVVASDVSTAQEMDRNIIEGASIG